MPPHATDSADNTETAKTGAMSVWLSRPLLHLQLLLFLAVLLGGGGTAYGLNNLAIQLVAIGLLAVHGVKVVQFVKSAPRTLVILLGLTLALPLLQLVPLPAPLWQALPGRELVANSYVLAGISVDSWAPLSFDRARTFVAFLGLIAPAAIIIIGATLDKRDKSALAWSLVAFALAAFGLGVLQIVSANSFGLFYPITPKPNVLYATFANRNSTGMLLVGAAIMAIALPRKFEMSSLFYPAMGGVLLVVGAILTQSRTSMVLLVLAVLFLLVRLGWSLLLGRRAQIAGQDMRRGKGGLLVAVLALLILAGVVGSAMVGGRTAASFERFTDLTTDRPEMWEDGLYAAAVYWPVGSGMGSFDEVFQVHESLEYVSPRRAGRAHNDFIEIAIEAGLAGLILIALWAAWCVLALLRSSRKSSNWQRLGAGLVLGCIGLQSLVDYPLRNQTLLCVAAVMIVLLASSKQYSSKGEVR